MNTTNAYFCSSLYIKFGICILTHVSGYFINEIEAILYPKWYKESFNIFIFGQIYVTRTKRRKHNAMQIRNQK